jgi:hypothetical protein
VNDHTLRKSAKRVFGPNAETRTLAIEPKFIDILFLYTLSALMAPKKLLEPKRTGMVRLRDL